MSQKADLGEIVAVKRLNEALKNGDRATARLWWCFLKTEHPEIVEAAKPCLDEKQLKWLNGL